MINSSGLGLRIGLEINVYGYTLRLWMNILIHVIV
jgi:hypothetical protein